MSNLTKNIITRGAVVALALSAGAATTANAAVTRTAGADRFSTATEIFKAWPTTTDTAILAAGVGHDVDALTVAPLAKMKNAPIILVDTTLSTSDIIAKFTAFKTVYIANGTAVVSPAVEAALIAAGKTVVRLGGTTRTDTALIIAKAIGTSNGIVVANGQDDHLVDTLSIASIAAAKGMPIFLTQNGTLDSAETTYAKGLAATNVYALGGIGVVSDAAVAGLGTTVTRLAGPDRYSTNAAVVTNFKSSLDLRNIYVASGEDGNLIDALAGAPLAGLTSAPIVFAHDSINTDVNTFLKGSIAGTTNVVILGGTAAVTDAVKASLVSIQANANLVVESVKATNSKTVVVKFTQAVLKSTVVDGSAKLTAGVTFTSIGSANVITSTSAGAVLSDDGKTLTITATAGQYFNGSYAVTVNNTVKDLASVAIVPYSAVIDLTDTVRPTTSVSYPSNGVARVTFSEPVNVANAGAVEAAMTITAPSTEAALVSTGRVTLGADNTYVDIALTSFTADKDYTITLVGLSDYAGNLISANPNVLTVRNSTVDNVKPTVVSAEALDVKTVKLTFSEKLSVLGAVNGENIVVGTNATVDSTGLIYTVTTTTASPTLTGVAVVTLTGFKDLSANVGDTYTKTLNFVADTTLPTFVSSEVKADGADQYLYIKYSENVVLGTPTNALTGTYVNSSSVTTGMNPILLASAQLVLVTGATTTDTIRIKVTGLTSGTYTVSTDASLVQDISTNKAASKSLTFAFGTYSDTTIPTAVITSVQTTEDIVVVTYSMDVTAASGLYVGNYTVEGQQVFASAIFDTNAHTVKLTLKPNAITLTGNRQLTVKNVATAAGKAMADYSTTQMFKENVKPYLASAKIASATTITATFSESVAAGAANEFEVYVDGAKIASGVTAGAAAGTNTITITLPTAITDLTKTYTVKFIGTDFVDLASTPNSAVQSTIVTVAK